MAVEMGPVLRKVFCGDAFTAVVGTVVLGLAGLYMAVGAKHLNDCPVESRIPDLMIVMGVAYALLGCLRFGQIIYRNLRTSKDMSITEEEEEPEQQTRPEPRGQDNPVATIIEEDESDNGRKGSITPPTEERKSSGVTFDLPAKPRRVLFQEPEPEVESEPEVVEENDDDEYNDDDDDELVALPEEEPIKMNLITLIECIILIFLGVWFVAGGLWVFRTEDEVQFDDPTLPTYCAPLLYKTAVWSLILALVILVIGLVFLVIAICVNCCCSDEETEDEEDDLDFQASVQARRSMALYLGDRRASAMFQHDRKKSIQWDRRRASMYDRRGSIYTYDMRRGSRKYDRRPTTYVPRDRRESTMSQVSEYGGHDRRQSTASQVLSPTDRRQSSVSQVAAQNNRRDSEATPGNYRRTSTDFNNDINAQYI